MSLATLMPSSARKGAAVSATISSVRSWFMASASSWVCSWNPGGGVRFRVPIGLPDGIVRNRHVIHVEDRRVRPEAVGADAHFEVVVDRARQRERLAPCIDHLHAVLPEFDDAIK